MQLISYIQAKNPTFKVPSLASLDWELTSPEGNPVPKDFLIASLASWILTSNIRVKECAGQLLQNIESYSSPMFFAHQWFARCCDKLFHNPYFLKISLASSVPMKGRQLVRDPSQILISGHADPLETALLLSALSHSKFKELGLRLVLFALSDSEEISYFLSWTTIHDEWHALEIANMAKMEFEENKNLATSQVARLLKEKPEIISALNNSGVFYEKRRLIIALDFARAVKKFHIRSLP